MTDQQSQALAPVDASVLDHYSKEELRLITDLVAPGIGPGELRLFLHTARSVGLDPLKKQIYAIERWDSQLGRKRMTIQTGIDGYRAIASRNRKYAGQVGPFWCGPDGKWMDVWLQAEPPAAARVGVWHADHKEPVWGVARWEGYKQTKKDGSLTKFWEQMGPEMLAKAAESLALRKAFPEDLSGVLTHEEMAQANDGPRDAEVLDDGGTPGAQRQAARLAARARAATAPTREGPAAPAEPSVQQARPQEPREVEVVDPAPSAQEATNPFAAGDKSGTGAISPQELAAYVDPAQTEGLHEYQVWPLVQIQPWETWCNEPLAPEGKKLHRWTPAEFIQGAEDGGRHQIAKAVLEKVQASHGPDTVPEGALRLDYCLAAMERRYDAFRLHHESAAALQAQEAE